MKHFGYSNGFVLDPHIFEKGEAKTGYPTEVSTISFWMDQMNGVMKSKPIWSIAKRYGPKKMDMSMIEERNDKFRSLVYLAVNHGATGIIMPAYDEELHFMYKDKTVKSELAGGLRILSKSILAGAILDEVTITNDNGKIDYRAYGGLHDIHLVAVNTSNTEVRPTIRVPRSYGTIYFLNEEGVIPRPPTGQFDDILGPYKTRVYNIRMRENVSIITDPEGNLTGKARKKYLDIVGASVYEEGDNFFFTVTMADDFPDPRQLREEDTFYIRWIVNIIENKEVDQGDSGSDYSIYLRCSNEQKWHKEWVKTSVVSKNDDIEVDTEEIIARIKDNTAILTFPKNYLPPHDFRWGVESSTRSSKGPSTARDHPKARRTFSWFPVLR